MDTEWILEHNLAWVAFQQPVEYIFLKRDLRDHGVPVVGQRGPAVTLAILRQFSKLLWSIFVVPESKDAFLDG